MTSTNAVVAEPKPKIEVIILGEVPEVAELTTAEAKMWTETKAGFIVAMPAFAHILYTLMNPRKNEHLAHFTRDPRIPTAAVNGVTLFINPDFFFKLPYKQRLAVIAHEILHCIFDHCGQGKMYYKRGAITLPSGNSVEYIPALSNISQDYIINDIIHKSYCVGNVKLCELGADWLHDEKIGAHDEQWPAVYEKLFKQQKQKGGGGSGQPGKGRFDLHLHPGDGEPGDKQEPRNEAEWRTQVAAAIASAVAQGSMPATLQRALEELLEPKVSWGEYIQGWMARKLGSNESDWRRPDRRMIVRDIAGLSNEPIYAPSRRGNGCNTVVIGIDTSGSIGNKQLQEFLAEVGGVLTDVKPQRLVIIWCDAAVNRVDEVEDAEDLFAIIKKGAVGGGGTAFGPVFKKVAKMGIEEDVDALLYLTDGLGPFPSKAPSYPVLWGSIYSKPDHYPFGDVVMIPKTKD